MVRPRTFYRSNSNRPVIWLSECTRRHSAAPVARRRWQLRRCRNGEGVHYLHRISAKVWTVRQYHLRQRVVNPCHWLRLVSKDHPPATAGGTDIYNLGKAKLNFDPRPTSDSTVTVPPCCSTTSLTKASPSPVDSSSFSWPSRATR